MADFNDGLQSMTDWLDEAGVTGGKGGTPGNFAACDAEFKRWWNRAYQEVYREVALVSPRMVAVDTELISWVSGTETYTLSNTDYDVIGWVEGGWESGTSADQRIPILPVDYEERREYYGDAWVDLSANEVYGRWYLLDEENVPKIGFTPVPGVSKTSNIKIWYHKNPAALTLTGDAIPKYLTPFLEVIGVRGAQMILHKSGIPNQFIDQEYQYQLGKMHDRLRQPQTMSRDNAIYYPTDIFDLSG